jgi:hypothetical protein
MEKVTIRSKNDFSETEDQAIPTPTQQGLAPKGHPAPDFFSKTQVSTQYPIPDIL